MPRFICRGRKLNTQLERAIQKAMAELDKTAESTRNTRKTTYIMNGFMTDNNNRSIENLNCPFSQQQKSPAKNKLVKIAPALDKK